MSITAHRSRFIRLLPGRIRLEFASLLHSKPTELSLRQDLVLLEGVTRVEASAITGRLLVVYDERQITGRQVLHQLELLESKYTGQSQEDTNAPPCQETTPAHAADEQDALAEVSATAETPEPALQSSALVNSFQDSGTVPETLRTIPVPVYPRSTSPPGVPLP
ncbi:HMA2 domain-containing protein, partial [Paenibacillus forsythiae]